jgi:hypothetical protein
VNKSVIFMYPYIIILLLLSGCIHLNDDNQTTIATGESKVYETISPTLTSSHTNLMKTLTPEYTIET